MGERPAEGVIQFDSAHVSAPLEERVLADAARAVAAWREILARLAVLGQDPARYAGGDYGNASARLPPFGAVPQGQRRFLVTGSRTARVPRVSLEHFALVERWDVGRNQVVSRGTVAPSSESLTHAALYDAAPSARVVLHGHAPEIWRNARALGVPATREDVPQGTPAMAREVQRVYRETAAGSLGILAMGGHEDGVLAFGRTAGEAGEALVRHLARALEIAR
jgi:ribulose-5-phosphate 4-epimerase/fuculose-1-phosphate aldolase